MPAKQNCFFCKATIDWSSPTAAGAVHSGHTPANRPTSSSLNSEETGSAFPWCSKSELCFQIQEKNPHIPGDFSGEGVGSGDFQGLSFFFSSFAGLQPFAGAVSVRVQCLIFHVDLQ